MSAAGVAINITGATNAVATFDNFNITSASGDLIHADPSTATINFTNTTATANGGNLLNATAGSVITFNASGSTLTGAIQTDATSNSKTTVVLTNSSTNNTTWNMTGSSTVTNLSLTNSSVVFSPSGGFKTLTVGSLVANTGANITLNTALGATVPTTDQIVVNGGTATGTTTLTIKNASANNAGAATTGSGIPVVVVTNGTTTTTAFKLASPVTAGGFQYTLSENASNDDWYLVSSPTVTVNGMQTSIANLRTFLSQTNSVTDLARATLISQTINYQLWSSETDVMNPLSQVSGCDCGGGGGGAGSFALGTHGRWSLSNTITLLAGAAFTSYSHDGVDVTAAPTVAASLRYDPSNWGRSRPFLEIGAALTPYMSVNYSRFYANGFAPAQGDGSAVDRSLSVFGRVGWVDRLTPTDEARGVCRAGPRLAAIGGLYGSAEPGESFPRHPELHPRQAGRCTLRRAIHPSPVRQSRGEHQRRRRLRLRQQVRVTSPDHRLRIRRPVPARQLRLDGVRRAARLSLLERLVADAFVLGTLGGDIG